MFHVSDAHGVLVERLPLTSIRAPLGVAPLLPLDEYHNHCIHGTVDGLPNTRRYPAYPIPTSGVSPDVNPFACLWYYHCTGSFLSDFSLSKDFSPTALAPLEPPPLCFEQLPDRSHVAALHCGVSSNRGIGLSPFGDHHPF